MPRKLRQRDKNKLLHFQHLEARVIKKILQVCQSLSTKKLYRGRSHLLEMGKKSMTLILCWRVMMVILIIGKQSIIYLYLFVNNPIIVFMPLQIWAVHKTAWRNRQEWRGTRGIFSWLRNIWFHSKVDIVLIYSSAVSIALIVPTIAAR